MAELLSPEYQRQLLNDLTRLVATRAAEAGRIQAQLAADQEAADQRYRAACDALAARFAQQQSSRETQYDTARATIAAQYEATREKLQAELDQARARIHAEYDTGVKAAEQTRAETRWETMALFEAGKGTIHEDRQTIQKTLDQRLGEIQEIRRLAAGLFADRVHAPEAPPAVADTRPVADGGVDPVEQRVAAARRQLHRFHDRRLPRLFQGPVPLLLLATLWLMSIGPAALLLGWDSWHWVAASLGTTAVLGAALAAWLYPLAKRLTTADYATLKQLLADAETALRAATARADLDCQNRLELAIRQRDSELNQADQRCDQACSALKTAMTHSLQQVDATYGPRFAQATEDHDRAQARTETDYRVARRELSAGQRAETARLETEYRDQQTATRRGAEQAWNTMAATWHAGLARFQQETAAMNRACADLFVPWNDPAWNDWESPTRVPPAICFGTLQVDLQQMEGGLPDAEELKPPQTVYTMPAVLPLPERPSLLLEFRGAGRAPTLPVMHNVMLRMLTAIPPGRLRLTIIDPIGLGESFAAFMHLADFDDQLVAERIWTESNHIQRRLAELNQHMENVIQKYLRNQFDSIGQYNAQAGEVAEPFHLLVVADFPAGFTEAAARRLARLAASGTRCGIFLLVSADRARALPAGFDLAELQSHATRLVWRRERFVWVDAGFARRKLLLEDPPTGTLLTDVVRTVGARAQAAKRVVVPFQAVAPQREAWWTEDSGASLSVPLGRAGATGRQILNLGTGTSQHALVAGKTGAGKSTLLHVLIVNLALRYSPDQIEFYLVDFKKGVEFKPYAHFHLPHARVIAIESEREFGLSVLERLGGELKSRGDRFRALGVQDLKAFRAASPSIRMPRILLIVDEFQELFVEDDATAQRASLLLDRLVRQGRAFGIHVLLGSQTLAGAYSLARSTLGQMAVRIALQCGAADAYLILSEENTAARLLSRPGEAIYNDGNGAVRDNHPFQVAWLDDAERQDYLKRLARYDLQHGGPRQDAIVFEGNVPADLRDNSALATALAAPMWPDSTPTVPAWLGAAVAIKEPTAATFQRHAGNNLIIVGRHEETAIGLLTACLVSLAAQQPPTDVRFVLCHAAAPDARQRHWLHTLGNAIPHASTMVDRTAIAGTMALLADELARRQASPSGDVPSIYLLIHDLARFRELRPADDDFGFSSRADKQPPSPAQRFRSILTEGPDLGIHTLVWCDSCNNVHRFFNRQVLRDIELRVLFEMSEIDSTSLMDSPAASRLGQHRAVLYDAQQGSQEKFRPYGLPAREWLNTVADHLRRRAVPAADD